MGTRCARGLGLKGRTAAGLAGAEPPRLKGNVACLAEIDALPWVAGLAIDAYGVRLGVRVDDVAILPTLYEYLPYGWRPLRGSPPVVQRLFSLQLGRDGDPTVLHVDAEEVRRTSDLVDIKRTIEIMAKLYVAEMARRHVFVHAGTVGWQGRAILVPGATHSGKTTLVAELVRAGATYYSDEYAVLDSRGRVHPYPQPLGLRRPGQMDHDWCPVEELGGRAGVAPIPVGLVVGTTYTEGATWQPRRFSLAETLGMLMVHTRAARRRPERVLDVLQRAVSGAAMLGGPRGEASQTAATILEALIWRQVPAS